MFRDEEEEDGVESEGLESYNGSDLDVKEKES